VRELAALHTRMDAAYSFNVLGVCPEDEKWNNPRLDYLPFGIRVASNAAFAGRTPRNFPIQFGLFPVFEQPICLGKHRLGSTMRIAEPAVIGEYAECEGTALRAFIAGR
jgi:hypothetical protein